MTRRELLESDALRSFAVFAEHRNFTTAAAALHLSQPSLHVKIRKLATALGVELYERHGRRLVLSPTGERLAAYALDSARRLDDFLAELDSGAGTVTIAAGRGAVRWVIGDAVRRVSASGRKVRVMAAGREVTLRALAAGRADVAVVGYDLPPPPFDSVEIAAYPQVLVVGADHPLAGRDHLTLPDLEGLDLVLPAPDRPHRRTLERALLAASVSWRLAAEADGWDLLVHLAGLGIGATVVNGCVEVPAGLVAVPVADLPAVRYWAAWRPQRLPLLGDVLEQFRQP